MGTEEKDKNKNRWERLKILVGLMALAFTVTFALIVGNRLSDEALGVLAGAVCGVGAAIPTSLLIVAVTRRRDTARVSQGESSALRPYQQASYPPVIVVSPSGEQRHSSGWDSLPPSLSAPMERQFKVVGDPSFDGRQEVHYDYERRS